MTRHAALDAFVLHQWNWSESSLIVDLFTRELGRVAVAAKGAKRPTSNLRAVLLPFQRIAVSIARPRGDDAAEVFSLRAAEYAGGSAIVPSAQLMQGFYLNELVLRLLARQDPHRLLFDAYADTLAALASTPEPEAALRAFELVLLRETGVLPDLGRGGVSQAPVAADRAYALHPEIGLVAAEGTEAGIPGRCCLALQAALEAGSPSALRAAASAALQPLRTQLRSTLHYHLGSTALRSRDTARALRRLLGQAESPAAS